MSETEVIETEVAQHAPRKERRYIPVPLDKAIGGCNELLLSGPRIIITLSLVVGLVVVIICGFHMMWDDVYSLVGSGEKAAEDYKLGLFSVLETISLVTAGAFTISGTHLTFVMHNTVSAFTGEERKLPTAYRDLTSGAVKVKMASSWVLFLLLFLLNTFVRLRNDGTIDGHLLMVQSFDMRMKIFYAAILAFLAIGFYEWLTHRDKHHSVAPSNFLPNHDGHKAA